MFVLPPRLVENAMPESSDRITVFHVRNSNYLGGIETTLVGWFKYADADHYQPRLQVFSERRGMHERSVKFLQEQGIQCEMLPWGNLRNLPGAVYQLWRRVRKAPNPVLQSHDTRSDLVAIIVSWLTGAPLVISNHAWHPAELKRKILEAIRARLMHAADLIISVSRNTHVETLERGVPASKCMYMYSGIDLEPYAAAPSRAHARKMLNLEDDAFVVGNIARLWPEKEQATLVEAAGLLARKYPALRVLIVGDGPLGDALRTQIRRANLEKVVLMPGYCEDFVSVLAGLDVFAFPSSAEGTPMVIYSAMAMGVPIVASPVSGVGEILSDGESGLFVPAADARALAAAIEKLIEDPVLAERLGEQARDNCYRNYSAAAAIQRLEKTYGKLMRNKQPKSALENTFERLSAGGATAAGRSSNASGAESDDRRAHERVGGRFPVEVELASGDRFTAYTANLSEGGMKLEYNNGASGELIRQGDVVKVALNSPFLAAKSVRVIEDFEVLACEPWDGTTWRVRLQSAASRDGLSTELTGLRPYEFVMPAELEDTFLQAQAQMNLNLPESDSKIMVFSAAESGAGNSTISWWFAVCLARTPQRRVLFIDGNVHARSNPSSNEPVPGFVDLLLGQETLENTVIPLGVGAPHLLNVGRVGRFTSGNLSPSQVNTTFNLLREHYDYVVIDAPPATLSPLTTLWAQAADGCMVVLEAGKSERDAAAATVSRLRQSGVKVLGAMLNKY